MGDKNASDTHVLNDEWTFYLNERPPKGISQEEYERSIHKWGVFSTIEGFWRHMNALDIQKLPTFSTLRMFKSGIKPSWEDPLNSQGGKYVLDTPKNITPRLWRKLVLAIIGGTLTFSDQIIWNRDTEEVVSLEDSLRELREVMGVDDDTSVNYQAHRVNNRPSASSSGSISRTGSLDFNSHVLERKKHHSNKHTESHGDDNGLSNGHVRTKEHSKRKADSANAEAADSSTTNGATATADGVSKDNGYFSPKAEKRKAERESQKRKEKKEKRDNANTQNSLANDNVANEKEEPAGMEHAVSKDTEHAAEAEVEPETKEKDSANTRSDEDGDDNGENADGFSKSVSARSIDWAEMAEEGEDEVSDTSWLTEDDMSEDIYTPYESEGEESLDPGFEGSGDANNKRENGSESVEEGRRRTDFKDIRDLPRTRSLSRERGRFDGSGQWQRPNNRQAQPGHRKNGSVGKFDKHENSPIRKSASNADIGPNKYKSGFKINPSNSDSTYRHKRSTSTSETSNDHHNRLYHSQDKMRSIRRPTPPPGFPSGSAKASLEPSPLSNTGVSPRAPGLSPRATNRASTATPTAKRTAPPTNPWKALPASILPATPKASFASIAGAGSSPLSEVSSTPPASPRALSPTSLSVRESPAPPPSSPVITPSKPSSYAAMCLDASPESSTSPASGWRAKDRAAPVNTTTTTTASGATTGGAPAKGFKREFFYKPRELMQPKTQPPQPQPPQGTAGVASGRRSRSPRGEQQTPSDDAKETAPTGISPRQQKPAAKKEELAQAQKRQPESTAPREAAKTAQHLEATAAPPAETAAPSQKQPVAKQLGGAPPHARATAPVTLAQEVQPKLTDSAEKEESDQDIEVEDANEELMAEEESADGEDGPGESVEEEDERHEEESVRRTPVKTPSRRKPQAKKTPSKASKRAPSKRTHRRSRGLVIDFLKAHEQEFYFIFAALMLLILAGTAVLVLGLPTNPLF